MYKVKQYSLSYSLPFSDDDTMATSPANELAAFCTSCLFDPPNAAAAAVNGFVAGERSSICLMLNSSPARATGKAVTATLCSATETTTRDAFIINEGSKIKT